MYFVKHVFTQDDELISVRYDIISENITYGLYVIAGLRKYIKEHPYETFSLCVIKPKESYMGEETVPAFGCVQCGSILDNCHVLPNTDITHKVIITLDRPIKVPANCWYKVNS